MSDVHVHVHVIPDAAHDRMTALEDRLTLLEAQGAALMARQQDVDRIITELNTATNAIATDLERLRSEVLEGNVNDASITSLDGIVARLRALGQDPENPVPAVPPAA
jgi:ABC-type transporter Mla subunit MlaD